MGSPAAYTRAYRRKLRGLPSDAVLPRGRHKLEFCFRGHRRSPENVDIRNRCRICIRLRHIENYIPTGTRQKKATCIRGHARNAESVRPGGQCRLCEQERNAAQAAYLAAKQRARRARAVQCACGHAPRHHDAGRECYHKDDFGEFNCECVQLMKVAA